MRANERGKRPSGLFKTQLSLTRNAPSAKHKIKGEEIRVPFSFANSLAMCLDFLAEIFFLPINRLRNNIMLMPTPMFNTN